jgi:hypothetical protein
MDGFAWISWFDATDYDLARQVLQRGVAALYAVGFVSAIVQFPALLGERGLLSVPRLVARTPRWRSPSLFRLHYSDRYLRVVCWVGTLLAVTVVSGLPQAGPPWVPLLVFLAMWVIYLSIVNVGQTFYAFGWESLLLEAGFLVAFLGSDQVPAPLPVLVLVRWLVFRLEFGAGMIKMRGDRSWRDLTALFYHHETQPMPNPLSRFAHLLPPWFHRMEVLGNHFAQLVVPWLLFAPQPVASIAAAVVIATQLWLVVTGNFAWLNAITIVLAFSAVSDSFLGLDQGFTSAAPNTATAAAASPLWWVILVAALTMLIVALSWRPLLNLFSRHQLMNASFNRWHLVNAYGAFGSVTKHRYEVIVEGTTAAAPTPDAQWSEYEFRGKPGDPKRIPPQIAPYHERLGWLLWFLALGAPHDTWFPALLRKLLEADPAVLKLLRRDPFAGVAPTFVRARLFAYRFATRAERKKTGLWWIREPLAVMAGPIRLAPQRDEP